VFFNGNKTDDDDDGLIAESLMSTYVY